MIKQIEESQLSECLDIIHESFITVADEFGLTPENCATNGAFIPLSRLQNDFRNGHFMFTINYDDIVVGFMQLSRKSDDSFELEKLAVLPKYRHNGYGKKLIEFAKAKTIELGANRITIGIIEKNSRLKDWYAANGFNHTGSKTFSHLPFTVGFMECTL